MPDPSTRLPAPIENPSPVLDPDATRVDTAHQLPPHRGKVGRMTDHVAAISADAREWVELRIELVKAEVTEKVDEVTAYLKRLATGGAFVAAAAIVALYGLGFLLATLAVGLGWLFSALGSGVGALTLAPLFWGLLITTVLLFVIAGVLALIGKRKIDEAQAIEARLKAEAITESDAATAAPMTRHQLQDLEAQHARRTTT